MNKLLNKEFPFNSGIVSVNVSPEGSAAVTLKLDSKCMTVNSGAILSMNSAIAKARDYQSKVLNSLSTIGVITR